MITRRNLFETIYIWLGGLFLPKHSNSSTIYRNNINGISFDKITYGVDDGKIVRCYGEPRHDQKGYMFECNKKGSLVPNLEGYAIIPIEKWEQLTGSKFDIC